MIKVERKKVGRPALSEKGAVSVFIRIPNDLAAEIKKKAASCGLRQSAYCRKMIIEGMKK